MNPRRHTGFWLPAILVIVLSAPLGAHLKPEKSDPAANAVLTAAPRQVQVWFTQKPDAAVSKLELRGPSNAARLVQTRGMGERSLVASVEGEMVDGVYAIQWQAAGDDGHIQRGEIRFTLKRAP